MKNNGPWKIKNSQEKYKNQWICVREDQVIRPDGEDGIFGVVEMVPGVSALPLDEEGFVYLAEQFRYSLGERSIEAACGGIDEGENPLEAAKRELKEELGIEADEWIELGIVNPFTTVVRSLASLYLVKKLRFGRADLDATEGINIIKVKLADAVKMVMESKISHGPSCVLILKTAEYLRKMGK